MYTSSVNINELSSEKNKDYAVFTASQWNEVINRARVTSPEGRRVLEKLRAEVNNFKITAY